MWNAGEPVEGYTNFLWVLLMAAGMTVGVDPVVLSTTLGIASGLTLLGALLAFGARGRGWLDPWVWLPVAALALSRSFTAWCSGGLETMFFTLLVLLGSLVHLRERRRAAALPLGSSLLFALLVLGGPVLRDFTIVLMLGVVIGTYSSIFVASPALIEIQNRWGLKSSEKKKRPQPATV